MTMYVVLEENPHITYVEVEPVISCYGLKINRIFISACMHLYGFENGYQDNNYILSSI